MLAVNQIKLHQNSADYLSKVFNQYTEVEKLETIVTDPVIHLYPREDTYDESGNLNGYIDAIFVEVHIYDRSKMTVYKSKRYHDAVNSFADLHVNQIKVFKDLSTMIDLKGVYRVSGSFGAFEIQAAKLNTTPMPIDETIVKGMEKAKLWY